MRTFGRMRIEGDRTEWPEPWSQPGTRLNHWPARLSIRQLRLVLSGLSCGWLLMVLLANPVGEFPLNDDWSYGRAVQSLVAHGHLQLTGFTSMPLIAQVVWGALFCLPFGFSFTALRLSTVTLAFVGMLATGELLNEVQADWRLTLLAVLVVGLNPLYFQLSLTFMTDVPFFTVSMLALLFLLRALRTERKRDLLLGYAFSTAAVFIRQLGVVLPLAFLLAYIAKKGFGWKTFQTALVPAVALMALLFAYPIVLQRTIGLPALYNRSFEPILESAAMDWAQVPGILADRLWVEWITLGLFLLPFSLVSLEQAWSRLSPGGRRVWGLLGTGLLAAMMGMLQWRHQTMPLVGNLIFDFGLGPLLLRDTYILALPHWPGAPRAFWLLVTALGASGSLILFLSLLARVAQTIKSGDTSAVKDRPRILLVAFAGALYAGLIGATGFLDRYLIFLMPSLMMLLTDRISAPAPNRSLSLLVGLALLLGYGGFALGGTHDYLAWNRARWQALNDLMARDHVSYRNIDGGFEFNGWYAYDSKYREHPPQSWWWVDNDDYMISFGSINGYAELRRYPFERWIPWGQGYIFVLRRVAEAGNSK